jgi:hypothetical protein
MDAREQRLAKNEVMFRHLNERVARIAAAHSDNDADGHVYEFLCECSNADCTLRVSLTLRAYEVVRADPTQFVVAPGHDLPEIEEVIVRARGYQIVRKLGDAADLVRRTDPREGFRS